jgi:hypothetical protein
MVKQDLLRYIQTSLFLAEKKVNPLLVLTTSHHITGSIDLAFVDRADIK